MSKRIDQSIVNVCQLELGSIFPNTNFGAYRRNRLQVHFVCRVKPKNDEYSFEKEATRKKKKKMLDVTRRRRQTNLFQKIRDDFIVCIFDIMFGYVASKTMRNPTHSLVMTGFGIVFLHAAKMMFVPSYARKIRAVIQLGPVHGSHNVETCLNILNDIQISDDILSYVWAHVIPSPYWLQYIFKKIAIAFCSLMSYRSQKSKIVEMFRNEHMLVTYDLYRWFKTHLEYEESIHALLQPIIRELYGPSCYFPLDCQLYHKYYSSGDLMPLREHMLILLQSISDWCVLKEHKLTQEHLKHHFPNELMHIIMDFADLPYEIIDNRHHGVFDPDSKRGQIIHYMELLKLKYEEVLQHPEDFF